MIKLKSLLETNPSDGLPCPNCGENMAFGHGKCPKCEAYCGCSHEPDSPNDCCDDHKNFLFPTKNEAAETDPAMALTADEKQFLQLAVKVLERISKKRKEQRGTEPAKLAISNIEGILRWNANLFEGIISEAVVVEGNMSRADFELIAKVINNLPSTMGKGQVAHEFTSALKKTNPLFNEKRFLAACGISTAESDRWTESKVNEGMVQVDTDKIGEISALAKKIKGIDRANIHLAPYQDWANRIIVIARSLVFEGKMNEALSADELRIFKSIASIAKKIRDNEGGPYRVQADHIITICNAVIKVHTK